MTIAYIIACIVGSFFFLSVTGMLAMWVDRKVTARLQFRVGPPWYQNFADFVKLSGKEMLIPAKANIFVFAFAPVIAVLAATVAGTVILLVMRTGFSYPGDIILIVYLLTVPSLAVILGGSASGNVLAAVGISREIKLLLGYELPFVCALIVPALKSGSTTSLLEIIRYQQANGAVIGSLSGIIGFVIALFALQGKIGFVPFDLAEAEGEIASGAFVEYSGILLGLFKLTKAILLIVGPLFLVALYFGGISLNSPAGIVAGILKYLVILVLIILIKNTNPRLRIDQALRFFWGWLTLLGLAAILLALIGR
ncbi:MAG TPA: NADH-quinone oxidoreductase subunit H [bacterium]|nr:NADH-quinone oxidoreductase subunit H [bacterium]